MLILGDCLKLMKSIPDKSIDMVLTDPPYGTTACKWDTVIPFEPMWNELKRIVKDNGAICLFGSEPFSSHLRLSNLKMFKYDWIWKKTKGGFAYAKYRPLGRHEIISIFGTGKINYFPIKWDAPEELIDRRKTHSVGNTHVHHNPGLKPFARPVDTGKRNPITVLDFKSFWAKDMHPTQKPVALLEYLIKTYTLENETVLDFTMGSGSTGVACKNLNRKFIGIEKEEKYFEIAKERIGA
ncbi:MAG: site-specific DNA-methyltransferase [bacterium]|nr:site-specific DNA-methyltransferase [bacterium]